MNHPPVLDMFENPISVGDFVIYSTKTRGDDINLGFVEDITFKNERRWDGTVNQYVDRDWPTLKIRGVDSNFYGNAIVGRTIKRTSTRSILRLERSMVPVKYLQFVP